MRVAPQVSILSIAIVFAGCSGSGGDQNETGNGPPSAPNGPLTIIGVPEGEVRHGEYYLFTPNAHGAGGDELHFEIIGKPAWAEFDPVTGALWGLPEFDDVGVFTDIEIRVSDGRQIAALGPFTIVVNQGETGSATLFWYPPTANNDGSILLDLAGYRIHYGRNPSALTQRINIDNPGLTTYVIENLSLDKWYFAVTSVNRLGIESRRSKIVNKHIA